MTEKVSGVALLLAVGMPLITPVALSRCSPAGSVPLVSVQVYGACPAGGAESGAVGAAHLAIGQGARGDPVMP